LGDGFLDYVKASGRLDSQLRRLIADAKAGIEAGHDDALKKTERAMFAIKAKGVPENGSNSDNILAHFSEIGWPYVLSSINPWLRHTDVLIVWMLFGHHFDPCNPWDPFHNFTHPLDQFRIFG
jgi:hypothetical protein